MAYENRKLIWELNRISFAGLQGFNVGDALSAATWGFQKWTEESVNNMKFLTLCGNDYKEVGESPEIAFVFSHVQIKRKDQLEKFQAIEKIFKNKIVITAKDEGERKNPFLLYIPIWYWQIRKLPYSSTIKKGICFILCEAAGYAFNIYNILAEKKSLKKLVCFFDVTAIDSLLIQKCNQQEIETFTLQHGIVNGSYDYIEYKCSHAKRLLAWGNYTAKMAIHFGMPKEKIRIVGNINNLLDKSVKEKFPKNINKIIVCTNGVLTRADWNQNKHLIMMANEVASKYNLKYYLKIHPRDDQKRYYALTDKSQCLGILDINTDIMTALKDVDMALSGNSTTFCDAIYYGIPSFRYISETVANKDVCRGITFGKISSLEDLYAAIRYVKENEKEYISELNRVRDFLYQSGNIAEKYKNAICDYVG